MITLDHLDAEDWRCAGFWRADDDWRVFTAAGPVEALAAPATPARRRVRKPTLESQLRQVWKAARQAGVQIAVTIEGEAGKLTVTPAKGTAIAYSDLNEWDRDLGTHPPEVRQ